MLTDRERSAVDRFLAEEEAKRVHVVVALSGAHAYGFPSPDSDVDVKAVHIDPTRRLLGLAPAPTGAERVLVVDGVEVDYSSNEIGGVLLGILKGNGNYAERILGRWILRAPPWLSTLQPLVRKNLSKRVHRHYRGFAVGQRQLAETGRTAKRVLYVLRTTLTGTHLLRTGELVTDVRELWGAYGFEAAEELVQIKVSGEKAVLADGVWERWRGDLDRAFRTLDEANEAAVLPENPVDPDALDEWLMDIRTARLSNA
jgi:predicted nucleotidyltransferase